MNIAYSVLAERPCVAEYRSYDKSLMCTTKELHIQMKIKSN